jgi:hypothetical protein
MNLVQVMHARWAAAAGLEALLPAARVYTGTSPNPAMPFAVLRKTSQRPEVRFNDGSTMDLVGVRIEVYHERYDAAVAMVEQIKATFDRAAFALAGNDRVVDMQRCDDSENQEDDGAWRLVIDFQCRVYLAG